MSCADVDGKVRGHDLGTRTGSETLCRPTTQALRQHLHALKQKCRRTIFGGFSSRGWIVALVGPGAPVVTKNRACGAMSKCTARSHKTVAFVPAAYSEHQQRALIGHCAMGRGAQR